MDWIEKLYFEQTLVNTNKNQEKSDGCEQVKRKNKKDQYKFFPNKKPRR